jgi:hypothetical protein
MNSSEKIESEDGNSKIEHSLVRLSLRLMVVDCVAEDHSPSRPGSPRSAVLAVILLVLSGQLT